MIILPQSQPARWIVRLAGVVVADGITHVGELTGVNPDYEAITGEGEAAFLAAAVDKAGTYNPLPAVGEECVGNTIYSYGGSFVICRKTHPRTIYEPSETPALFLIYREGADQEIPWIAGEWVEVGYPRTYDGKRYRCYQAHWTEKAPPEAPALWTLVIDPDVPAPWVLPTGAHDAYQPPTRVIYQGNIWQCASPNNVWAPGVYGWTLIGPAQG